ncbi:hypothetical protein Tco_0824132 [Tanacetum coccineum]|uniref:Uncharacterized protein n=1 Tax=Tanacetum coccineum TaxID=301880 RepID=A0ABQ5AKT9_9ASTR
MYRGVLIDVSFDSVTSTSLDPKTHRHKAPRSPKNPKVDQEVKCFKMINYSRFCIPQGVPHVLNSTSSPVPTVYKADEYLKKHYKNNRLNSTHMVITFQGARLLLERQQNKEETDKMITKAILQEGGRLQAEISSKIQQAIDNHIPSLVNEFMKFETLQVPQTTCRTYVVRPRDQDDPHDDAPPEGENSTKRQKTSTSEYEEHVNRESSEQVNEREQRPSSSGNQEQVDDYDFWTQSYASDDDEMPTKQMKNFLKSDIVWESRKEILASPHPRKTIPLVQSWPEKIVLSLHKFPVIIFNDVDIEERKSRWVNKCVKKFNPYGRYSVEHWKNPHAKIFYIKRQKEHGKPKEVNDIEIYTADHEKEEDRDYAETVWLGPLSALSEAQ